MSQAVKRKKKLCPDCRNVQNPKVMKFFAQTPAVMTHMSRLLRRGGLLLPSLPNVTIIALRIQQTIGISICEGEQERQSWGGLGGCDAPDFGQDGIACRGGRGRVVIYRIMYRKYVRKW